jgi:prepilin-type N-terminal cleavage/methylation domain-containing protein
VRARSGFTLLEAAVAISIISIVVIGAMAAFGADLRAASRAERLLPAASLAAERMAVLELADPMTLRALPDSLSHGRFVAPFDGYAWTAAVRDIRGDAGLMELAVKVTWSDGEYDLALRRYRPLPRLARRP